MFPKSSFIYSALVEILAHTRMLEKSSGTRLVYEGSVEMLSQTPPTPPNVPSPDTNDDELTPARNHYFPPPPQVSRRGQIRATNARFRKPR